MRVANRAGGILLGGALVTLVISAVMLRRDAQAIEVLAAQDREIDEVEDLASSALSALKDAETGQRGYLITHKDAYLEPYRTGVRAFDTATAAVGNRTANNPQAHAIALKISRNGALKKREMDRILETLGSQGHAAAVAAVNEDFGKRYMDAVRKATAEFLAFESAALARNRERETREEDLTRNRALVSGVVLFLMTLGGAVLLNMEIAYEHRLAESLDASQKRYRELADNLDKQVEERTRELRVVNQELSAFSYSVSHDLRAPLRSIDGFSQIVLEDYTDQLPPEAVRLLERIRTAGRRMGQLIQSLLELSRVTRHELVRQPFSLTDMAASVVEGLRVSLPGRDVAVTIAPDMRVEADPNLTRALLDNLIQNAWKFTSKRPDAKIEIGQTSHESRPVFFVRDNGAGFDPRYADRLFTPFQRLHPESEFEGTGIGLATVQRVVSRHSGRIWAESNEGEGATFYFALS